MRRVRVGRLAAHVCVATLLLALSGSPISRAADVPEARFVPPGAGNGLLAFASDRTGNEDIYTVDKYGGSQTNLTNVPASDIDPAWSPAGDQIAFVSDRDGNDEIYTMSSDGSNLVRLTNDPGHDVSPAWSPDGAQIAFVSDRSGNDDIYVLPVIGGQPTDLSNNFATDLDPAWSPTGKKIAFASDRTGDFDIYSMSVLGTRQTNLTNDSAGQDTQPAWSPDASKLAFTSDRAGNPDVHVMKSSGGQPRNFTANGADDREPFYSPDGGTRIGFTSDRDGNDEVYLMSAWDGSDQSDLIDDGSADASGSWQPLPAPPASDSPIQHIVILYMENHSFNDVLGRLCVQDSRCDGATTGVLLDGSTIPLARAKDIVPIVGHSGFNMRTAVNGGLMNGWQLVTGCEPPGNGCYVQFEQDEIPNLWNLASTYTISDRTFQLDYVSSWGSHLELASADMAGFELKIPQKGQDGNGPGWGCDSFKDIGWHATEVEDYIDVPACVPRADGSGPYRQSPVQWVPTIMDRAGLTWQMYVPGNDESPAYGWSICPSFAQCIYTNELENVHLPEQFSLDAEAGNLASLSIVVPHDVDSQHNGLSMMQGDNWIADQVSAVMSGPDWSSSAIFITYDDCGCFYDYVPPPEGLGIRVPMIIISPFARPAYTDSNVASYASILAFIERTFSIAPLAPEDANSYNYSGSFDYGQHPMPGIPLKSHPVSDSSMRYVRDHPPDHEDPT